MTDPAAVLDLLDAFRRSKAMFTAVSLGIFDQTPANLEMLAEKTGANPAALERLLDACVGLGLLSKQGGAYSNQPVAAKYLRRSSPESLVGYVLYSDQVLFRLWANLEDALREGTPRWRQTFGLEGPIFDHFFRTDEAMRTFLRGMHGVGVLSASRVMEMFDLSGFRKLVDLGGGTGYLAIAACERYPQLRAVVFDLARVMEVAREEVALSEARDRIELVAGDFFAGEIPPADLYAVSRILHDWPEHRIKRLLKKIRDRLPPGGALLILEKLLDEDKSGPTPAHMQSLNMLVCTEGKERSLGEYRALLQQAGFGRVEGRRTGSTLDAVLAWKG
jgi:acetylserotonin N-methyltransferase